MNQLLAMLKECEQHRFYGVIEVKFVDGKISLLRKTQTFVTDNKPTHEMNRGNNGNHTTSR